MANDPQFAATLLAGAALVPATADTSMTAPTNVATVVTAGASGSKIESIVFQAVGTTVAGTVNVFAFDGTTYNLIDQVTVPAVTSSTTSPAFSTVRNYPNLLLPSGWSIRVTNTIAGNVSLIKVTAFGGSF